MSAKIFLFSIVIVLLISSNFFSQNKCKPINLVGIGINVIPSRQVITQTDIDLINILKKKLGENKLIFSEDPSKIEYEFLISTKTTGSDDTIFVSVLLFERLPKEAIEIAVKGDAFYKVIGEERPQYITADMEKLRDKMNEDYIRNFGQITESYIEEIKILDAEKFFNKIIKELLGNN